MFFSTNTYTEQVKQFFCVLFVIQYTQFLGALGCFTCHAVTAIVAVSV